jgi:hypothetical protein
MINRDTLTRLWSQPEFQKVLKEVLLPGCPPVPEYSRGKDQTEWVYGSGMKAGYLLALKNLGIEND